MTPKFSTNNTLNLHSANHFFKEYLEIRPYVFNCLFLLYSTVLHQTHTNFLSMCQRYFLQMYSVENNLIIFCGNQSLSKHVTKKPQQSIPVNAPPSSSMLLQMIKFHSLFVTEYIYIHIHTHTHTNTHTYIYITLNIYTYHIFFIHLSVNYIGNYK